MTAFGHQRFAVYGTDVGMPIAYALAADHRDRLERLVVSEAPLPEELLAALATFLAPYRDGPTGSTSTSST
jgi:pimeloyl-ACP methyl ester carboxylesterase